MAAINSMLFIHQQNHFDFKSDLSKQLIQKTNILGSYSNSLESAISTIKKSQRLIDITGVKHYQKDQQYDQSEEFKGNKKEDYNA